MIFVERSKFQRPAWFGSSQWAKSMAQLATYFERTKGKLGQRRLAEVAGGIPPTVCDALWRLFDGRCAMCEVSLFRLDVSSYVEHLAPIEVEESDDRYAYVYAALLWENLILLCPECHRARGNRFPLYGSQEEPDQNDLPSAAVITYGDPGETYHRLLEIFSKARSSGRFLQIDPTSEQPARLLEVSREGEMEPNSSADPLAQRKAFETIRLFQLNRKGLRNNRRKDMSKLRLFLDSPGGVETYRSRNVEVLIDYLIGEYQFAKAWVFVRHFEILTILGTNFYLSLENGLRKGDYFVNVLDPVLRELARNELSRGKEAGSAKGNTGSPKRSSPSAEEAGRTKGIVLATTVGLSRLRIEKVKLKNFRQFRELSLEFPKGRPEDTFGKDAVLRSILNRVGTIAEDGQEGGAALPPESSSYCGWKMLLGENGAGKSSLLQAIALALIAQQGGKAAMDASLPKDFDLRKSVSHGAKEGSIQLWMEDASAPTVIRISEKGVFIKRTKESSESGTAVYLRCYGATRLIPPLAEVAVSGSEEVQSVGTLFDPYAKLIDPVPWLLGLAKRDSKAFRLALITLKDLLDLPAKMTLKLENWHGKETIGMCKGDRFTPLDYLSSGYQAIVVLGCDIMAGFLRDHASDMQTCTGVILLDEIGTNLHPRWRLRIVQALRRAFPMLQFIASTHEPLCLRGLGEGEVSLLTVDEEHYVQVMNDLPSPAAYRVDQLLTSAFFGLRTAYDPDEEAAFDLYHGLLVAKANLNPEQKELLDHLEEILKDRTMLGNTAAERGIIHALEMAETELGGKTLEHLEGSGTARASFEKLLSRLPGNSSNPSIS